MTARIQLPAQSRRGEVIEGRILIQHDMETGFRFDDVGKPIPRNVINALSCHYNGVEVFRADMSSGIAANPYLQFYTVAEASGDFVFTWVDDEGRQDTERQRLNVVG